MGRTVGTDGRKGTTGCSGCHASGNLNGKIAQFFEFLKIFLVDVQLFQFLQAHRGSKINVLDFLKGRHKRGYRTGENLQLLLTQLFKGPGNRPSLLLQTLSGVVHALVGCGIDFIGIGVIHNGLYSFPRPGKARGGGDSNKQ